MDQIWDDYWKVEVLNNVITLHMSLMTLEANWLHCVVSLAFAYLVCRNLISESLSELDSKTLDTLGQNHP